MKRDLKEEYQSYVESQMPDLWSRIEPNLRERKIEPEQDVMKPKAEETEPGQNEINPKAEETEPDEKKTEPGKIGSASEQTKQKKTILYFMKRAVPAAACIAALVIGLNTLRVGKSTKEASPENAGVMEESAKAESMEAEAAEMEAPSDWDGGEGGMQDNITKETAYDASSPSMEETEDVLQEDGEAYESVGSEADHTSWGAMENSLEGDKTDGVEAVEIGRAVLLKIAVVSQEMKEEGYAYAYTFSLEDESRLIVYLTKEQCDALEEDGITIERQAAYSLIVRPLNTPENGRDIEMGESYLEKIEKLP